MTTLCISKISQSHNIPKTILIPLTIGITSVTVSLISLGLYYFTVKRANELEEDEKAFDILFSAFEPGILLGLLGISVALICEFNVLITKNESIPRNGKIILLVCIILFIVALYIMFIGGNTTLLR